MSDKPLLTVDELLAWLNEPSRLHQPIKLSTLRFWLRSRAIPADRRQSNRDYFASETAAYLSELIRASQLLKQSIVYRHRPRIADVLAGVTTKTKRRNHGGGRGAAPGRVAAR